MGLFDLFRKKQSEEDTIRKKIRKGFEDSVKKVKPKLMNDPMMDGLLVQGAMSNFYLSLKSNSNFETLCILKGLDFQKILTDEFQCATQKYLE